jgi:hypothetical protein
MITPSYNDQEWLRHRKAIRFQGHGSGILNPIMSHILFIALMIYEESEVLADSCQSAIKEHPSCDVTSSNFNKTQNGLESYDPQSAPASGFSLDRSPAQSNGHVYSSTCIPPL